MGKERNSYSTTVNLEALKKQTMPHIPHANRGGSLQWAPSVPEHLPHNLIPTRRGEHPDPYQSVILAIKLQIYWTIRTHLSFTTAEISLGLLCSSSKPSQPNEMLDSFSTTLHTQKPFSSVLYLCHPSRCAISCQLLLQNVLLPWRVNGAGGKACWHHVSCVLFVCLPSQAGIVTSLEFNELSNTQSTVGLWWGLRLRTH